MAKYPVKQDEGLNEFIPGKFYVCVQEESKVFKLGYAYLCCRYSGKKFLVMEDGGLHLTEALSSKFIRSF